MKTIPQTVELSVSPDKLFDQEGLDHLLLEPLEGLLQAEGEVRAAGAPARMHTSATRLKRTEIALLCAVRTVLATPAARGGGAGRPLRTSF